MKVNIIIGGFQKCGTTALHHFLSIHPKVVSSSPKEIDFFNYDNHYLRGPKYYHSHFKKAHFSKKVYLDGSPSYMNDGNVENTCSRIFEYNPKMKVICSVRNPIDRAFSAWQMYRERYFNGDHDWWVKWVEMRTGKVPNVKRRSSNEYLDFGDFVKNEIKVVSNGDAIECNILSNGMYSKGIRIFKNHFEKNFYVLKNEDLNSNTDIELNKLSRFLNLDEYNWEKFKGLKVFKGGYDDQVKEDVRELLKDYYSNELKDLQSLTSINYL